MVPLVCGQWTAFVKHQADSWILVVKDHYRKHHGKKKMEEKLVQRKAEFLRQADESKNASKSRVASVAGYSDTASRAFVFRKVI